MTAKDSAMYDMDDAVNRLTKSILDTAEIPGAFWDTSNQRRLSHLLARPDFGTTTLALQIAE